MDKGNLLDQLSKKVLEWMDEVMPSLGKQWKVFILSFVAQFVISSLLSLGIRAPRMFSFLAVPAVKWESSVLSSPIPEKLNIFNFLKPKLEEKINNFQLQKETSFITSTYAAADYEEASAYIVVDSDSGEVLANKNLSQRLPVASLTKIMTAVIALDLSSPDETFTVPQRASLVEPTTIGVVPGERMTLQELLQASLMTSANDAVEVIREGVDQKYGQEVFVKAMNEKASILGLKDTHFQNPQGFDNPGQYSSVADLAVLSHYALTQYPLVSETAHKDYQFLPADLDHKQFDLYNWNGLLDVYPGVSGLKIGNTDDAGYTTVVVSERDGHKLMVVLLGAPGVLERDLWASQLLDLGFGKFNLSPVGITEAELRAKYATWKYFN
ncbi:MAG: D-alanyl-D-alanine carboxypeptidase family protein [bacterium]|nr:D-alanyl-D-alanine carboxypeptidase family protein [bacterium]